MEKRMTPSGGIERCHDEGSGMIIVDIMVMFKSDNVANQEGTQDEVREAGLATGEWCWIAMVKRDTSVDSSNLFVIEAKRNRKEGT
eukprot:scaffold8203_cov271-Chaetoceros_neogracile.AAC.3